MRKRVRRAAGLAVSGVLLVALISGCTLTGAEPAPLTPVGDTGSPAPQEPTDVLPPTPTEAGPIDVFGTQTAQAPATQEPGGEVTPPTDEATQEPTQLPTPTPEVQGTPGAAECPPTYTVQPGDNLFRIAMRFGLTTEELATANGITNVASIQAGAVLNIPGCDGTSGGTTTGGTGSTGGEQTHTVQAGENLYRIALRYGITWQRLAEFNGITNPNTLSVGQVLRIPSS